MKSRMCSILCFDAFSSHEPVSASIENALRFSWRVVSKELLLEAKDRPSLAFGREFAHGSGMHQPVVVPRAAEAACSFDQAQKIVAKD